VRVEEIRKTEGKVSLSLAGAATRPSRSGGGRRGRRT
jgi:hypothetical protein